jgi:Transcriptional regulator
MGEKAEYKSAIRSRRLIRQAFIELMQEKDLEKITVTDIITRADLNRGTFYAHYQDTRAVIEQIETEIVDKMLEFLGEFQYKNFFQNPAPLLLKVARYLEEDLEFYRILINSKGSEEFLVRLKSIFVAHMATDTDIPESYKDTPDFILRSHFFAGGIVNLYQAWFRGEFNFSFNEISLAVSKIITSSSTMFFE